MIYQYEPAPDSSTVAIVHQRMSETFCVEAGGDINYCLLLTEFQLIGG